MKSPAQSVNPGPSIRRWPVWLAAIAICFAIVAAYHDSFRGPFVFDDEPAVLDNPTIRQLWPIWRTLAPPPSMTVSGRPLANLTLAINYAVSGTRPWSYHVFNLEIHVLAALTLFGVVRRTLDRAGRQGLLPGSGQSKKTAPPPSMKRGAAPPQVPATGLRAVDSTFLALAITLLWALHPLQTEAVTYVVQRVESLMSLLFLLTLYCFIRSVDAPRPRAWKACAIAACFLGAATKEVIALAPILVLLYDRTFVAGSFAAAWRQRWRLHVALASTWVILAAMIASTGWDRNGTSGFDIGIQPSAYWLTQFEAVARYLWLSFWPHPLVFEYGTFWVRQADGALAYAMVVVPLAIATLIALWRRPVLGFLGAWFFGILSPTSIMPGRIQMIVEHRMYLPVAALLTLAAVGAASRFGRAGLVALLAWAAALGCLTESRNTVYRDAYSLWSDTVAKRPDNDRAHNNLGNALVDRGAIADAIIEYQTALRLRPEYPEAHSNLGNALLKAGRGAEAIAECQKALQLEPAYAKAHNNLANALLEAGRNQEALVHYHAAIRLKPDDPKNHYNLGNAWLKEGRLRDAIAEYETALRLQPDDAEARYNLANSLLQADRVPEAIAQYLLVLGLKPGYLDAHTNLGNAYLQSERVPEAIAQFETVLQAQPDYAPGHNNLGAALFHAGRAEDAIREFQTALRLKPDYADARGNLQHALAKKAGAGIPRSLPHPADEYQVRPFAHE
jgi:tetratricopeptide (TPR) repeat protein